MSDYGLFEDIEGSGVEQRTAQKQGQLALDSAIHAVREGFPWLRNASSRQDYDDRVALAKDDMLKVVAEHLMPKPNIMRKVVAAVRPEFTADTTVVDPTPLPDHFDNEGGRTDLDPTPEETQPQSGKGASFKNAYGFPEGFLDYYRMTLGEALNLGAHEYVAMEEEFLSEQDHAQDAYDVARGAKRKTSRTTLDDIMDMMSTSLGNGWTTFFNGSGDQVLFHEFSDYDHASVTVPTDGSSQWEWVVFTRLYQNKVGQGVESTPEAAMQAADHTYLTHKNAAKTADQDTKGKKLIPTKDWAGYLRERASGGKKVRDNNFASGDAHKKKKSAGTKTASVSAQQILESAEAAKARRIDQEDGYDWNDKDSFKRFMDALKGADIWIVSPTCVGAYMSSFGYVAAELLDSASDVPGFDYETGLISDKSDGSYTLSWAAAPVMASTKTANPARAFELFEGVGDVGLAGDVKSAVETARLNAEKGHWAVAETELEWALGKIDTGSRAYRLIENLYLHVCDSVDGIFAGRKTAEETPDKIKPPMSGTDAQGVADPAESLDPDKVETQPKDASRKNAYDIPVTNIDPSSSDPWAKWNAELFDKLFSRLSDGWMTPTEEVLDKVNGMGGSDAFRKYVQDQGWSDLPLPNRGASRKNARVARVEDAMSRDGWKITWNDYTDGDGFILTSEWYESMVDNQMRQMTIHSDGGDRGYDWKLTQAGSTLAQGNTGWDLQAAADQVHRALRDSMGVEGYDFTYASKTAGLNWVDGLDGSDFEGMGLWVEIGKEADGTFSVEYWDGAGEDGFSSLADAKKAAEEVVNFHRTSGRKRADSTVVDPQPLPDHFDNEGGRTDLDPTPEETQPHNAALKRKWVTARRAGMTLEDFCDFHGVTAVSKSKGEMRPFVRSHSRVADIQTQWNLYFTWALEHNVDSNEPSTLDEYIRTHDVSAEMVEIMESQVGGPVLGPEDFGIERFTSSKSAGAGWPTTQEQAELEWQAEENIFGEYLPWFNEVGGNHYPGHGNDSFESWVEAEATLMHPDELEATRIEFQRQFMSKRTAATRTAATAGLTTGATHRVAGWDWDYRQSAFVAQSGVDEFSCTCGTKIACPSYGPCSCGKIWNSTVIATNEGTKLMAREIQRRDVLLAART